MQINVRIFYIIGFNMLEQSQFGVGLVVGLRFWIVFLSMSQVQFHLVSILMGNSLWLRTGPPQVGGEIGPLQLVGPWIGYRVLKKNA
jgi:hypothetical protein